MARRSQRIPTLALAVGNEGADLAPGVLPGARVVSLPIAATVESLNVAVAAGSSFTSFGHDRRPW